jgi:lauroyl/myristoyl acyltransferase
MRQPYKQKQSTHCADYEIKYIFLVAIAKPFAIVFKPQNSELFDYRQIA